MKNIQKSETRRVERICLNAKDKMKQYQKIPEIPPLIPLTIFGSIRPNSTKFDQKKFESQVGKEFRKTAATRKSQSGP